MRSLPLLLLFVLTACAKDDPKPTTTATEPTTRATATAPAPKASVAKARPAKVVEKAIADCKSAIDSTTNMAARVPVPNRAEDLACESLYREADCGNGLGSALRSEGGIEALTRAINACADRYCDTLEAKPRLCEQRLTFIERGEPVPADAAERVAEFDEAILSLELPAEDAKRFSLRWAPFFMSGPEIKLP